MYTSSVLIAGKWFEAHFLRRNAPTLTLTNVISENPLSVSDDPVGLYHPIYSPMLDRKYDQ